MSYQIKLQYYAAIYAEQIWFIHELWQLSIYEIRIARRWTTESSFPRMISMFQICVYSIAMIVFTDRIHNSSRRYYLNISYSSSTTTWKLIQNLKIHHLAHSTSKIISISREIRTEWSSIFNYSHFLLFILWAVNSRIIVSNYVEFQPPPLLSKFCHSFHNIIEQTKKVKMYSNH